MNGRSQHGRRSPRSQERLIDHVFFKRLFKREHNTTSVTSYAGTAAFEFNKYEDSFVATLYH